MLNVWGVLGFPTVSTAVKVNEFNWSSVKVTSYSHVPSPFMVIVSTPEVKVAVRSSIVPSIVKLTEYDSVSVLVIVITGGVVSTGAVMSLENEIDSADSSLSLFIVFAVKPYVPVVKEETVAVKELVETETGLPLLAPSTKI